MNTNKLPRHADLDSQIMPLEDPFKLVLQLGCLATALIGVVTWLGLFGLMIAEFIGWAAWPFVVGPIAGWLGLLGLPALLLARRGTLAILSALVVTAEAWLSRAGFSIDLNRDSYIGHIQPVQIEPQQTLMITPAVWSGPGGTKLLAQDEEVIPDLSAVAEMPQPGPIITRRLWNLPGEVKCPEETVINFVERIFIIGWDRRTWVGPDKPLEREVYDALVNLLVQAQLLEGRKPGAAGRLAVDDPATAKRVLGLG